MRGKRLNNNIEIIVEILLMKDINRTIDDYWFSDLPKYYSNLIKILNIDVISKIITYLF